MLRFSEYLEEAWILDLFKRFSQIIGNLFHKLQFGGTEELSLSSFVMNEDSSAKGSNGIIAEYVCARTLAQKLSKAKLKVLTSIDELKNLENEAIQRLSKKMTDVEIDRAKKQGAAIAESIYSSIINKGQDLIFTSYEFVAKEHSFEVEPTGAQTNKGVSSDLTLRFHKMTKEEITQEILISLKAYKSSTTSQGSKSSTAALSQLFTGKTLSREEFIKFFGSKGKKFYEELDLFKKTGEAYLKSKSGKKLAAYLKSKGRAVKASGNVLRNKELGDNFEKKFGYKQELSLSKDFVDLFSKGVQQLSSNNKDTFINAFKKIAGFDDVVTYNAIANSKGVVTEVVNSNVSSGYKKIYDALKNDAKIILKHRKGTAGSIDVEIVYGSTIIRSLSLAMWKDGTIQFKFDSKK